MSLKPNDQSRKNRPPHDIVNECFFTVFSYTFVMVTSVHNRLEVVFVMVVFCSYSLLDNKNVCRKTKSWSRGSIKIIPTGMLKKYRHALLWAAN